MRSYPAAPCLRTAAAWALMLLAVASPAHAAWPTWPATNVPVCAIADHANPPVALTDGQGGTFVAWPDFRPAPNPVGFSAHLFVQHLLASGDRDPAWPENGAPFHAGGGSQLDPVLVADGAGGLLAVWRDQTHGLSDVYVHHMSGGGVADASWPAPGVRVTLTSDAVDRPAAATDGAGGVYVLWNDDRAGQANPDIYAHHVLASGAVDPAWPAGGLPVSTFAGFQQYPRIVDDGTGGAFIAWWDRNEFQGHVHHLLAAGMLDPAWAAAGVTIGEGDAVDGFQLLTDGAGGVIAALQHWGSGWDVAAEHVLATGATDPAWPATGVAVCTAPAYQQKVRAIPDGAGGAFLAWVDYRASNGSVPADLYAHHVLATGVCDPAWPVDGVALPATPGVEDGVALALDGAGGMFATWVVRDYEFHDLLGQHVLASGAFDPAWPADGRPVSIAPGDQVAPVLVADGAGGAVAAWLDTRAYATRAADIYAQQVTVTEFLGVGDEPRRSATALGAIAPNPGAGAVTIDFTLATPAHATLDVVDVAGRLVARLADTQFGRGNQRRTWDGCDARGAAAPGLYFAVLHTAGGAPESRRIVRLAR